MNELIGQKLSEAIKLLETKGLNYEVIDNNFNVDGDQKLVTNIIANDNTVVLITGDFIFDIKGHKHESK
ncbi:MAG: hypothetical protein IJ318_02155 [Clostridia bacterium]|nr:hypothetical protein [Clostridia bacterium]